MDAKLRVVVVDDDPLTLAITRRLLMRSGYEVVPCDHPRTALREVLQNAPFAVIADLQMPDVSGADLLQLLRSLSPRTRRVLYTGESHVSELARAMTPVVADAIVAKAEGLEQLPLALSELRSQEYRAGTPVEALGLAVGMARALASSSVETFEHARRLSRWARRLGIKAQLDAQGLLDLEVGALLHDVGMMCVPEAALRRAGPLEEHEWQQVHLHPGLGADMLSGCQPLSGALPVVRHHHERFDGRGYPDGLLGIEIPLSARLFAVVDTFEALTQERPYAPTRSPAEAREELVQVSGSQLDPHAVELFLSLDPDDWNRPSSAPPAHSTP